MEALLQYGLHRGGGRLFLGEGAAGDGVHGEEGDGGNDEHRDQRQQDALADIAAGIVGEEQRAADQHQHHAQEDLGAQDAQRKPADGKDHHRQGAGCDQLYFFLFPGGVIHVHTPLR